MQSWFNLLFVSAPGIEIGLTCFRTDEMFPVQYLKPDGNRIHDLYSAHRSKVFNNRATGNSCRFGHR